MSVRRVQPVNPLQHAYAALCVGLLLALGIFGASANLHAALHGADARHATHQPTADDGCAITLFASGVEVPVDVPAAAPMPRQPVSERLTVATDACFAEPDHRLRPGRGPPRV